MKVMIVCSGNSHNFKFEIDQAFIYDQVKTIKKIDKNIDFSYFFIKQKGLLGYLTSIPEMHKSIRREKPDVIHAHFALSAIVAIFQRKIPVVCTFHGSDINFIKNRIMSLLVQLLSKKLIFVSKQLFENSILKLEKKSHIIPCGVDLEIFKPIEKKIAINVLGLKNKYNILFSSAFSNPVKNYNLLRRVIENMTDKDIKIIELKDMNREQVALYMNAVDACVLTSFSEGSPQFIKEAMACNCPIVATKVGDIEEVIGNTINCYVTEFSVEEIKKSLEKVLVTENRTNGFERIQDYDNLNIGPQIIKVYESCRRN